MPGGRIIGADRPIFWIGIAGEKAMRTRLRQFSRSVQGAIMRPIVEEAGNRVRDLARTLAPMRTGALRAGIVTRLLKWGAGYCQYKVTLEPQVYYGKFHEYGLGDQKEGGLSKRTARRRANATESLRVRRRVQIAMGKGDLTFEEATKGLQKRERRRQKILAKGGLLQGMRKPNMAPHPFLRPAVKFLRTTLREWMLSQLWASLRRWSVPPDTRIGRAA